MRRSLSLSFFCVAAALSMYTHADEQTEQNTISSKSITVIATKNPQDSFEVPINTAKVDMSEAQYQNSTNLSDIFRNTAGVEIQGGPVRNAQQFSMRGYNSNGIIYLLDGTRQNFVSGHNSNIFLDPSLLKQVELVKGSSSAIYGSGGLGGVISFETKDAKDLLKQGQKLGFMQKIGYFSGNHEKSSVSTLYGASEKLDAVANVTYRDAGTLNLGDGTKYDAADSKVKSGMFKVNYAISDNQKLKFNVQTYNNDSEEFTNPSLSLNDSAAVLSDKTAESTTTKLAYEFNPNSFVNFSAQAYQVDTNIKYDFTSSGAQSRNFDLQTRGLDIHNVSTFASNENFTNRITYGVNYFEDDIVNKENNEPSFFYPNGKISVLGVFVQDEVKAITQIGEFSIIPSVRFDRYDAEANEGEQSHDDAFSPRLAVGYMPKKWLNIFGSASKAFRAPTISEKYLAGAHYGLTFLANPNLEAEKNTTYEGGFGLRFSEILTSNDNFNFKTSYFHTDAKDFIQSEVDYTAMTAQYMNVGSATIDGVDLSAEYRTPKFTASIAYNYTDGKDDNTGEYLTTILPQTIKTNFAYNLMQKSVIGFRSTFAESLDNVNSGTDEIAGYGVHDIYTQYDYNETLALAFSVNNIFDKAYHKPYTVIPQIGRDYRITLSYKY